ncbi:MAG TPA: nucleotidyltransferase domain-containing protein [Candidatus Kapabacteria bacterium]|nr:nucleotidyltransferase domain-containing protein [Candidatus Kapabacteria bacterium]
MNKKKNPEASHQPLKREPETPAYRKFYSQCEAFLKKLLADNLPADCRIFLFGSRATGKYSRNSDIDIGVMAEHIDQGIIIKLKEIIEESFVPFKVDIIDFSRVDDNFRTEALKKTIQWK